MLDKLVAKHSKNSIFLAPKTNHDVTFGIQHFAGPVRYTCKGMLFISLKCIHSQHNIDLLKKRTSFTIVLYRCILVFEIYCNSVCVTLYSGNQIPIINNQIGYRGFTVRYNVTGKTTNTGHQ